MNLSITTEHSPWLIIACLIVGAAYAFLLYRKDSKLADLKPIVLYTMAILRFVIISLISFFLLSPLVKSVFREVEKPIIIIVQDNSESVLINKDSTYYQTEYSIQMNKLIKELSDKHEVVTHSFGSTLKGSIDFSFSEKETNISSTFKELENLYSNKNIGAIIVATDGLYNRGSNPSYSSNNIKAPIYCIALGDTSVKKDLILSKVIHNRFAYLGNNFPLEILINAQELKGKSSILTIKKDSLEIFNQKIELTNNNYSKTVPIILEAKETGLQHYKIELKSIEGELSIANNKQDIFIEVLNEKQKIALIANAPHPDVAAIKHSVEENQNYEIESFTFDEFKNSVKIYSLIILHQPNLKFNKLITELKTNQIPTWIIGGEKVDLPISMNAIASQGKINEAEPAFAKEFTLFTISEDLKNYIPNLPAISCPFGSYSANNASSILFYQKIGVVATSNPLMFFSISDGLKQAVTMGEGLWKWKLRDYADHNSQELFNEFISKTIQYLAIRADKSFLRINSSNIFNENDPIEMHAELYNESYELINEPEINIVLKNENGKKYTYTFGKIEKTYHLNAGILPVGSYTYEAYSSVGNKKYKTVGKFSISPIFLESVHTTANHQLLYQLAKQHNGEMVDAKNMNQLVSSITKREDIKPISYSQQKLNDLINIKWLFFLILLLLSSEWLMRKRNGSY